MKKTICSLLLCFVLVISGCSKDDNNPQNNNGDNTSSGVVINDYGAKDMTQEELQTAIDGMGSCNVDSDCEAFYGSCPLGCHLSVNKSNLDKAQTMMNSWVGVQTDICVYDCAGIKGAECKNNKCVAIAEDIRNSNSMLPANELPYEDTLKIAGIGPDISFESTIGSSVLALHKTFEDHSDHLFIDEDLWKKFATGSDLKLPGNKVYFKGKVQGLDAGAGNHYYKVIEIDELKKVGNPSTEEVKDLITAFGFCEKDTDCKEFYGVCPLDCGQAVNVKYFDITQEIMSNFEENKADKCTYKCMEIKSVKCNNYKCETEQ